MGLNKWKSKLFNKDSRIEKLIEKEELELKKINFGTVTTDENLNGSITFIPERVDYSFENGMTSLIIESKSETNTDTSIYPCGRSKKVFPEGFEASKEYTLFVKLTVIEEIKGPIDSKALGISVVPIIDDKPIWNYANSKQINNMSGDWILSVSFKIPEEATSVWFRLNGGMTNEGGKVRWSNLTFTEGIHEFHQILDSSNFRNLFSFESINEKIRIRIQKDKMIEYGITTISKKHISLIEKLDVGAIEYYKENLDEINLAKKFLINISNGETTTKEIPLLLKQFFDKYSLDYEWFFKVHKKNAVKRFETLVWLVNNLESLKPTNVVSSCEINENLSVFTYWADGFHKSPAIIKAIDVIQKNRLNSFEIIKLDETNIDFFIDIPPHMKKLTESSIAHLSDYYRVALLKKYGGIWMDATVIPGLDFEERIQEMINNDSVVVPRYENILEESSSISNWFIASPHNNNRLIIMLEKALDLWVYDNFEFSYYFMFHAMCDFIIQLDSIVGKEWREYPFLSAYDSHKLQKREYEKFNEELIQIMNENIVNKMTYKIDYNKNNSDSMISKIVRDSQKI